MKITLRGGPYDGRTLNKPTIIRSTVNLVVAERGDSEPSFSVYTVLGDEAHYVRRSDLPFGGFYVSVAMLDENDAATDLASWREYLIDEPVELTALHEIAPATKDAEELAAELTDADAQIPEGFYTFGERADDDETA